MKLDSALFVFDGGAARFQFTKVKGKPQAVVIYIGGRARRVENSSGKYKPCETHCQQLLNAKEKQRLEKAKAALAKKPRAETQRRRGKKEQG